MKGSSTVMLLEVCNSFWLTFKLINCLLIALLLVNNLAHFTNLLNKVWLNKNKFDYFFIVSPEHSAGRDIVVTFLCGVCKAYIDETWW